MPLVIVAGLAARFGLSGAPADAAGGVFYTVLVYLLIAFARPSARPAAVGMAALAFSTAIELFQLTSVPADLGASFAPLKLVLGSSFVATDLIAYAAGAVVASGTDAALRRRATYGSD
jgi:Protein of unknown function (DUF2809)